MDSITESISNMLNSGWKRLEICAEVRDRFGISQEDFNMYYEQVAETRGWVCLDEN